MPATPRLPNAKITSRRRSLLSLDFLEVRAAGFAALHESAFGPKRTTLVALHMSAFGAKADTPITVRNVR
jgi:hypothetical protein